MQYLIQNTVTGDKMVVETDDPVAYIEAEGLAGYVWNEYAEPPIPVHDPATKLTSDKAFGQSIVDSFLSASKAANLGLYETEILDSMLDKVERYLLRGSISVAKEALELVEPNQLFPAQAKAYYLQLLTNHLNE